MKLTDKKKTELVFKLIKQFHDDQCWGDGVLIYADNKRYSDGGYGKKGTKHEKDGISYYEEDDMDVKDYLTYCNPDTISLAFEGLLYDVINYEPNYLNKLDELIKPYDLYFEQGNAWNMSAYEI